MNHLNPRLSSAHAANPTAVQQASAQAVLREKQKPLNDAKLHAAANAFLADQDDVDDMLVYPLKNGQADKLVRFAQTWFAGESDVQDFEYEASESAVYAVRPEHEDTIRVCIIDRKTGAGQCLGEAMDLSDVLLDDDDFADFFPSLGMAGEVSADEVFAALLKKAKPLDGAKAKASREDEEEEEDENDDFN